jgi:hypothetical protein
MKNESLNGLNENHAQSRILEAIQFFKRTYIKALYFHGLINTIKNAKNL